jgi:hypothetical protein
MGAIAANKLIPKYKIEADSDIPLQRMYLTLKPHQTTKIYRTDDEFI